MRRFFSYGPINPKRHYYAPRKEIIEKACARLKGEYADEDGHYITVWAPRQCGKTWIMQEVVQKIKQDDEYEVGIISLERAKEEEEEREVLNILMEKLQHAFARSFPAVKKINDLPLIFTSQYFQKPVILILDEFDALQEVFINRFASIFRDIFISRTNEKDKGSAEKSYLLHGLALVGVRSVLGIENATGSPFNVQRSLHIPNLTVDEVRGMFRWYEEESGQKVEAEVVDRLFGETRGQPGLTCWLAELLSEGFEDYTNERTKPIGRGEFETVYMAATTALPNNNILNLISKARKESNKAVLLEMFKTERKLPFTFDEPAVNDLYMNGIADKELIPGEGYFIRFSCPLVQKRLFNYFSGTLFRQVGQLVEPFQNLDHVITEKSLHIPQLLKLYETYLEKNKGWLFKEVPRRSDLRVYEAVFHFNLFAYLHEFLRERGARVFPEFPTGNGKIDLLIRYQNTLYGIELKSFTHQAAYRQALTQAAHYGRQLRLSEIFLVNFVETVDEATRQTYEKPYHDPDTGVTVTPLFIQTGPV